MICANCAAENPVGRRFCDSCGTPLAAACPNCGEANRSDARFCGSCGTTLAGSGTVAAAPAASERPAEQPAAERRLVSVLFADLVGFTPFAEERDPEQVREVLERYFATARTVIERHGGTVEKFIGDAVMAVWGTPTAHEDDAERAVRAALELLPAVRAMDARLAARAAVLTGEAAINVGAAEQGIVAGDLVNTCARLQAVAAPGTVLVGESTMHAASRAIAFEPAGERTLKGKAAPVPAWRALRVVADRGGRRSSDSLEPPFVGREAEMTLLKDLLHATTREQRVRLVAVSGPAGIGKSRLAWELQKYLDGLVEDVYWHRGRSPSYGEGISYWALGEMVRRRCGLAENDAEETTRARVAETVAQFVPAEDDRRWVEPAVLALLGVEEAPAGGREVLFAAWRIFFERIAARGTTVLLFEDLQFADSGLLDFIDHLLEWSKGVPILVLALARPELLERRPSFGSATRHFHSLPLEPLPAAVMHELLDGLVPGLPDAAVAPIVARADGIPLYAVETIRMLIADGRLESIDDGRYRPTGELGMLAVPDTLRSLISSRLDALEPDERSIVQHGAVLGHSFSTEALAAVSGREAEQLAPSLRALVRRDILTLQADPRSPERGQYGFVQGLIREVAYATLSRRDRRERHLAAARHLEALGDEEVAGALASHYVSAHRASDAGPEADAVAVQARIALRAAAERAAGLGAHDQALAYLQLALEVTTDAAERADLLERSAVAADAAGRYDGAERMAREAIAAHEALGQPTAAASAAGLLGVILVNGARMSEAIEVFEQAIAGLGDESPELRATLKARLARAYMRTGNHEAAVAAADHAIPLAEQLGLEVVVAEAMLNKGTAYSNIGRNHEALALLEATVRLAERLGEPAIQLRGLNNLASVTYGIDPRKSGQLHQQALELAERLGMRGYVNFFAPNIASDSQFRATDWDAALALLERTYESAVSDADRARQLVQRLSLEMERGELKAGSIERLEGLMAGLDDPPLRAQMYSLRSRDALLAGDFSAALEYARQAAEIEPTSPAKTVSILQVGCWSGNVELVREAVRLADELPGSSRLLDVLRVQSRAAVAALEGRRAEAVAGFKTSIQVVIDIGGEFYAATSVIAALTVVPGDSELLALAERSRAVLERVGARRVLAWLDRAVAAPAPAVPAESSDAPVPAS